MFTSPIFRDPGSSELESAAEESVEFAGVVNVKNGNQVTVTYIRI